MTDTGPRFTATGPIRIARLSNKTSDEPDPARLYVGFSDLQPRRFYDRTLADNPKGRVRWWNELDGYEYGRGNLTDEGRALFDGLLALPDTLRGIVWELWLPWSWRTEYGDMVRVHYDIDDEKALVEHITRVLRDMYGEDVEITVDL